MPTPNYYDMSNNRLQPKISSSTNQSLHPSPLCIYETTTWTCHDCGVPHHIKDTSHVRPLGHLRCPTCKAIIQSMSQIQNLDASPIEGAEFVVSIPPGEFGPPRSVFGSICCNCGRSHVRHPFEMDAPKDTPVPRPSDKDRLRKKILDAYNQVAGIDDKTLSQATKEHIKKYGRHPHFEGFATRKAFKILFDKKCTCGKYTCALCPKFKAVAPGEWVTQVYGITYEMLQRLAAGRH